MAARPNPRPYYAELECQEQHGSNGGRGRRSALAVASVLVTAGLLALATLLAVQVPAAGGTPHAAESAGAVVGSLRKTVVLEDSPTPAQLRKEDLAENHLLDMETRLEAEETSGVSGSDGSSSHDLSSDDSLGNGSSSGTCSNQFKKPRKPHTALEHNGIVLDDVCIKGQGPHHVFIIGDWGGLKKDGKLTAVSHLNHRWNQSFKFVWPADTDCQFRVRDQMKARAPVSKPAYVLNVGDNFYWGGVEDYCGGAFTELYSTGGSSIYRADRVDQFKEVFEDLYNGPGLDGKMWLGVLGNHDWGGWRMDMAWDQAIGYTWSTAEYAKDRWMTPALYYAVKVNYDDFSVDYYFLDTNVWDALPYGERPPHNICGPHNERTSSCKAAGGPEERGGRCLRWFEDLWQDQKDWLDRIVPRSSADWRVVVTHFPPYWGKHDWVVMAPKHEIDVMITGHRHSQNMHMMGDPIAKIWADDVHDHQMNDFLDPTAWVVSGGGGGITSEHVPDAAGNDDQYGFVDMTVSKEEITFEAISHGGQLRRKMTIGHAYSHGGINEVAAKKKEVKEEETEDEKMDKKGSHKKEARTEGSQGGKTDREGGGEGEHASKAKMAEIKFK